MSPVFLDGEKALFIDSKKRRYLVTLNVEGEFHSHSGFVPHTSIIGQKPGIVAETVNCHSGNPKRPASSAETIEASAVGSIAVMPLPACSLIAATVASGE